MMLLLSAIAAVAGGAAEVVRIIADQRPQVFDSGGRDTSGLLRVQLHF